MSPWLNALLTAAISGAATATVGCMTTSGPIQWSHCGILAATGAAISVVNLFRQSPTQKT